MYRAEYFFPLSPSPRRTSSMYFFKPDGQSGSLASFKE
jgi:hypothetical protein